MIMKKILKTFFVLALFFLAVGVKAAPLQVSAWIPYWRETSGTTEAIAHISNFTELSPFGYTVKPDGTLVDTAELTQDPWLALFATAKLNKVKIIPTVMWGNADAIDAVLRNSKSRATHVKAIVAMVKKGGFDGVDIDYEGKYSKTKKYFSQFLHDLYYAIGNKVLSCTIEARTPLDSRFAVIPADIEYSNDYNALSAYCNRVRIMTYDQGTIDLQLNQSAVGPYVPVADPKWVEKVVKLAEKNIAKSKIVIGIATYGYEYNVAPLSGGGYLYDRLTAFDQNYALGIASSFNITPQRNGAGELSFSYTPTSTPPIAINASTSMATTPSMDTSVFGTSAVTNSLGTITTKPATPSTTPVRMLWWSDASAITDKIALAKKLGVRGVVIFKLDGGADPNLWGVLK